MNQTRIPVASYASVGGIVGGVAGVIVLVGAFVFFYSVRRRSTQEAPLAQAVQPPENIEEPQMTQSYDEA